MGGSVDVESQEGKGTEFIINIKTSCIVKKITLDENQLSSSKCSKKGSPENRLVDDDVFA
jgi:hypothetical protein